MAFSSPASPTTSISHPPSDSVQFRSLARRLAVHLPLIFAGLTAAWVVRKHLGTMTYWPDEFEPWDLLDEPDHEAFVDAVLRDAAGNEIGDIGQCSALPPGCDVDMRFRYATATTELGTFSMINN